MRKYVIQMLTSYTISADTTELNDLHFYYCTLLSTVNSNVAGSVNIPGSINTIGDWAFKRCYNIKTVGIPEGVKSIGNWTFQECSQLQFVSIPYSMSIIPSFSFFGCSALTSVFLPWSIRSIGDYSFYGTTLLTRISFSEGMKYIGYKSFAFSGLTSVKVPNSITAIQPYAFYSCEGLVSVTLPSTLTNIGDFSFAYTSITTINIPSSVIKIGQQSFQDSKLVSLVIPQSVTILGIGMCYRCTFLKWLHIMSASGVILDSAFESCNSLKTVTIDNGITTIGYSSFYSSGLISVQIPASVNVIDEYAFADSLSLISLTLMGNPQLVIHSYAFANTALPCVFTSSTYSAYTTAFPTTMLDSCVSLSLFLISLYTIFSS